MWQIIDIYVGILVMMIGVVAFGKIVLDQPLSLKKRHIICIILIVCIAHAIIYQYLEGTIKTIIISLINMFLYKFIFKISISKSIVLTFLYTVILIIPDALELIVATNVFGISKEFYYNEYAGGIICNSIVCILFILIVRILKKQLRALINIKIESNLKLIIYMILTLICTLIIFYKAFGNLVISLDLIVSIFAMIVFIVILFSLIKQTLENNRLTNEYDKLLEFMITYENEIENQRILRHEVKNEFRTIRAKICDNQENKEIIEYIDEIVNDKYEVNKEKYAKFGYLPPNGIKGLCYFKTQEAEDKGINVSLNISKRIKNSTIYNLTLKEQRDFGRILGVLLDNAIEASMESKEKQIGIEAYINTNKEFKMIITNTYNNKIDKNKIGKETFTTKGKNRGHGLLLVKQLVGKNSIFEIKTDIQKDIYTQIIEIKKL